MGRELVKQAPDWCKVIGLTWYDAPRLEKDSASELAAIGLRLGQGVEFGAEYPKYIIWDVKWHDYAMSFENWITNLYGRRDEKHMVDEYRRCWERLERGGGHGRDLHVQAFLKDERYPGKLGKVKPRCVMKVSDLAQQVYVSPFVSGVTMAIKRYCREIDESIVYDCGFTAEETGDWVERMAARFPYAIENDYSEFEARVTYQALTANHEFYKYAGAPPRTLRQFATYYNPIFHLRGFRFRRIASRVSGVSDTSLGNSHANALAMAGCLAEMGFLKGIDYALIVKGDDSLCFTTAEVVARIDEIESYIVKLGMKTKMIVRSRANGDYERMEYCSCRFIEGDGGLTMVTKFGRTLASGVQCPPDADWSTYVVPVMVQYYIYSPSSLTRWFAWRWLREVTEGPLDEPEVLQSHLRVYGLTPQQFKEGLGKPTGPVWRIPDNFVTRTIIELDCPVDCDGEWNSHRPRVPFVAPVNSTSRRRPDTVRLQKILTRNFHSSQAKIEWPDVDFVGWEHL